VPVRVLQRDAGLAHARQAAQDRYRRPGSVFTGQAVTQISQQAFPASQQIRSGEQRYQLTGNPAMLVLDLADGQPATMGNYCTRPDARIEPKPG
jgi:hypothetical protein